MTDFYISDEMRKWLLEGDPSIVYLVYKDLLYKDLVKRKGDVKEACHSLNRKRQRILLKGWAKTYLDLRNSPDSRAPKHWGQGFYQPKWISSHYTLLELCNIACPLTDEISETIEDILENNIGQDGGINPHRELGESDVCINGMFLRFACYYGAHEDKLKGIIDYVISQVMDDGGFNCRKNRSGAVHSSLHSTISVLEGIESYYKHDYIYRLDELLDIKEAGVEFILMHKLFKSDKTDKVIHKSMTMLSYPNRWKFDILRGLLYMVEADIPYDKRMEEAMEILKSKVRKDGRWPVQAKHQGSVFFDMEKTGGPSRMNTYRALKVLKTYGGK